MVFFNYATMQMAAKIVYYGPGLCGKTTNLHHIYTKTSPQSRGEMVSLETETDRTLFFDLLPIDVGVIGGFKTRLQLYTVPGQVFYNTTRKLVLKGVDGIVFVADSQKAAIEANMDSIRNLRENLAEIGLNLDEIPLVLQLNKRDLPNIATIDEMLDALDPERRHEYVESVAASGVGVFETLKVISKLTLRTLRRRMTGEEPVRPAAPSGAAQFRVRNDAPPAAPRTTIAASTPTPAVATPVIDKPEEIAPPEPVAAPAARQVMPEVDRRIIADAPVAEPAPPPAQAERRIDLDDAPSTQYVPPPELARAEPDIDFNTDAKPQKSEPEVKTVKVRSSVDVMAELEALRKRATNVAPKPARRDILADLANLRPKRDLQRTVNVQVPSGTIPRAKSVRVTLSFEDANTGVIESRDQHIDLGDTADVQSLSVNLKIESA
jgi:mutual gliding-motility protein MglA